jgi:t-SNARE complex subunit (syntaxin)
LGVLAAAGFASMSRPTNRELLEHIHELIHHEERGLFAELRRIKKELRKLMTTLAELKQMSADNAAKVQANTDEVGSIKTLVEGIKERLVKIQADLDAALASGNQAAIEEAAENLRAETASLDAQTAALDALKNTASDPSA